MEIQRSIRPKNSFGGLIGEKPSLLTEIVIMELEYKEVKNLSSEHGYSHIRNKQSALQNLTSI